MELTQTASGWTWLLWSGNGQPLCRSARLYTSKKHAVQSIEATAANWACTRLVAQVN